MTELDPKMSLNIIETIGHAELILSGAVVPMAEGQPLIFDLIDPTFSGAEMEYALDWVHGKLGREPEDTAIKVVFLSSDSKIAVTVYDVPLGPENSPWYIAKIQHVGKKAMFVLGQEVSYHKYLTELGYKP